MKYATTLNIRKIGNAMQFLFLLKTNGVLAVMIFRKETCSNSLPVECSARETNCSCVRDNRHRSSHAHPSGLCQSGTARPSSSDVWQISVFNKRRHQTNVQCKDVAKGMGRGISGHYSSFKASELSRVETETVSYHCTDSFRNQCQNPTLMTSVLKFPCNYSDVSLISKLSL